ncbi:hypothetical protein B0H10DRAFT_761163 [Mycena sp. CBHHK59/15]|nr:hypothetical protein B0H10DRAFT_761163 [Mycena sp. CBHHK59/15]
MLDTLKNAITRRAQKTRIIMLYSSAPPEKDVPWPDEWHIRCDTVFCRYPNKPKTYATSGPCGSKICTGVYTITEERALAFRIHLEDEARRARRRIRKQAAKAVKERELVERSGESSLQRRRPPSHRSVATVPIPISFPQPYSSTASLPLLSRQPVPSEHSGEHFKYRALADGGIPPRPARPSLAYSQRPVAEQRFQPLDEKYRSQTLGHGVRDHNHYRF